MKKRIINSLLCFVLFSALLSGSAHSETLIFAADKKEKSVQTSDSKREELRIEIHANEDDWHNKTSKIKVKVIDASTGSKFRKIKTVDAKIGENGSWQDITDAMSLDVNENCTVYVRVIDSNDYVYEKSKYVESFDFVPPTLNAAVNEGVLSISAYDTESGVKNVYVNEYRYVPDENGIVTIRLQQFDATYENFAIYAVDRAGNSSEIYKVANPYYIDPQKEATDAQNAAVAGLPAEATPTPNGTAQGEITAVTDEDGKDISKQVKAKQFYTITTKDGQQYFLVIDMTKTVTKDTDSKNTDNNTSTGGTEGNQEKATTNEDEREENASVVGTTAGSTTDENGTVYFLTTVSNSDLLHGVQNGEQTLPHNSVATGNNIDDSTISEEKGKDDDAKKEDAVAKEEKKEDGGGMKSNLFVFGLLIVVAAIVITVKVAFGKKGNPGQSDDEYYEEEGDEEEYDSLKELDEEEP